MNARVWVAVVALVGRGALALPRRKLQTSATVQTTAQLEAAAADHLRSGEESPRTELVFPSLEIPPPAHHAATGAQMIRQQQQQQPTEVLSPQVEAMLDSARLGPDRIGLAHLESA